VAAWYVYILRCGDGTLYTGITTDVARRLAAHNLGRGAKYTRSRLPVALAWVTAVAGRGAASRLEREIKRLSHAQKLDLVASGG
jgi:putative endonuclease